ncbi:MAG: TonB-dependent receptor [Planctomycetaceae bacterium]|nr:TonB-dependent receptor [Planctomycetales bacterium]MCB9924282.1 TonB-dependent receptor [Planctomycetaceae bacterium]
MSISITDDASDSEAEADWLLEASLLQPQPLLLPSLEEQPNALLPQEGVSLADSMFGSERVASGRLASPRQALALRPSNDLILGAEAKLRVSTDSANLLGKSPSALGIGVQRRTPIVTDPRIRGSRIGSLAASGSHWIPARIDLDTMLSKIDSRIVDNIVTVQGPYSVLYGPGFSFIDIQLLQAPRYQDGFESHGSTTADFKSNGEQLYGRQEVWGGGYDWGFRVGYGHRTGNDYLSGNGTATPASYNSRDLDVALGMDLTDDSSIEFSYLRLDQTNVEFPGQAFDMDFLVTDGYEIEYTLDNQANFDRLVVDGWYNRTRFEGSAQRPGKRRQFPFYDFINFVGNTDVDSMSTGTRAAWSWGDVEANHLTAGFDFRYVKQELNEISSGRIGLAIWTDANSPIPDSYSANPGAFAEYTTPVTDRTTLVAGIRGDAVTTNVTADAASVAALGLEVPQHSLEQILGTNDFDQNFSLWSSFLTLKHNINDCWTFGSSVGYGQRPPNLTELYAAQSFMFLLQNGLNTVTGDPTLAPEKLFQLDLGINFDNGRTRAGIRGFHAWARDYITFEATRTFTTTQLEQVSLQYVNTNLATLAGGEMYFESDVNDWMTPFATLQYVEGRDQTRNGDFATQRVSGGTTKQKVYGMNRGSFTTLGGSAQEPLPGISPLESRVGLRIHEAVTQPAWTLELSARMVASQDRVATSLAETPTSGFTVWDLRGSWQAFEDLLIVAGIENFTDKNYQEHLDFRSQNGIRVYEPGINFYVGTDLTY